MFSKRAGRSGLTPGGTGVPSGPVSQLPVLTGHPATVECSGKQVGVFWPPAARRRDLKAGKVQGQAECRAGGEGRGLSCASSGDSPLVSWRGAWGAAPAWRAEGTALWVAWALDTGFG